LPDCCAPCFFGRNIFAASRKRFHIERKWYGWNKRTKEIARKQKSEEKIERRQGKNLSSPVEETPDAVAEETIGLGDTTLPEILRQWNPDSTNEEKI
jgi:hypothetical protein